MTLSARPITEAMRFQSRIIRGNPGTLLPLITTPFLTATLLAIFDHIGREDIAAYAVIAPAIMALLGVAIGESGEIIFRDRNTGVLEAQMGAPSSFASVLAGRIGTVLAFGLIGLVQAWLVAALGFGVIVAVEHLVPFVLATVLCLVGMVAMAILMAATFVVGRSVRAFQNAISYPLFLFGGVLVPLELLPTVVEWIGRLFFLSWVTDLLRDSVLAAPVENLWPRLGIATLLVGLTLAAAIAVLSRLVQRLRTTGNVSLV
ncbi:ABC transporter permease [Natronoglycomyces albus]|uniref:ABC transporter permease n=1 Tax=Natronoglycomyces albus TaxID=2811108 RepID=A0A895XP89_9ACTN|nr:ABC transporter permease [Natronoglycomyces albus]QSB05199.1 ABC transporter permease [Natronoglycomyces albus]